MTFERNHANVEARKDLNKSIEHLLTDIHEEINNEGRPIKENVIHSQKRFYSLVANIAESNDKLSRRVLVLTVISVILATIQVLPLIFKGIYWLVTYNR